MGAKKGRCEEAVGGNGWGVYLATPRTSVGKRIIYRVLSGTPQEGLIKPPQSPRQDKTKTRTREKPSLRPLAFVMPAQWPSITSQIIYDNRVESSGNWGISRRIERGRQE